MKTETDRGTLLQIYRDIKRRCYNPRSVIYSTYGAKGITVCDEWLNDRESFIKWCMENGYRKGLSVTRIDTGMGYSPDNCVISDMSKKRSDSVHGRAGRRKKENLSLYGVEVKAKHPLWKRYVGMHERCERSKHPHYDDYGGRGITVCGLWSGDYGFTQFKEWAENSGYSDGLTIDRIDNNLGYYPENCRWATYKEQANNKRSNRIVSYRGEQYTVTQLAEMSGLKKTTLKERLNSGWSVEDAVNKPVRLRTRGYRMSERKDGDSDV